MPPTSRNAAKFDSAAVDDIDAFTIEEFCRRHRFSVQAFYKHRAAMPVTFSVGNRVLISRESATAWRRKREREQAPA
jgi:hypothetical protein